METQSSNTVTKPYDKNDFKPNRSGRAIAGLLVVAVGSLLLAREMGVDIPRWFFRGEMILIVLGLFIGFRHSFRGIAWIILIGIGTILLVDDYFFFDISLWPLLIIAVGLFMIFRPGRGRSRERWKNWEMGHGATQNFEDDHIDSTAVFGGVKKNVISKNFRGGEATTFFGGTEINLMQAEVDGKIVLDLTNVFGGTKLIVPPHWKIHSEDLVCIFGGIEDKRPILSDTSTVNPNKVLILKGTCVFGGIDIKSY